MKKLLLIVSVIGFLLISCEEPKTNFDLLFEFLNTLNKYTASNGNTVYYKTNLFETEANAIDNKFINLSLSAGYYGSSPSYGTVDLNTIPSQMQPIHSLYFISYSVTPDKSTIQCMTGKRNYNDVAVGIRTNIK